MSTIVESGKLVQAAAGSLGAAILVSLAFSLLIRGATRSTEHRRQGRTVAASAYLGVALIGLAGCLAAVVVGLLIMTSK
jgi:uncharacterized membrane protein YozB (DUF420 family)